MRDDHSSQKSIISIDVIIGEQANENIPRGDSVKLLDQKDEDHYNRSI